MTWRPADEVDVAERMHTEFDAAGGVVAPSDLGSFAHAAGLAPELADALTDIMAALQHGSDSSREDAIAQLVQLSVETAEADREQATLFRSAVVAGGALPELVAMLGEAEPWRQALAAAAVHALAVDDPTTDDDNFHSLAICEAGAVAPLVRLLGVDSEEVQASATGALAQLAENPICQQMIAAAGALPPLLKLATFGGDVPRLLAVAALDVLSVNNPLVHQELLTSGAPRVLQGLSTLGTPLLREQASSFHARLKEEKSTADPKMDHATHVRAARDTRMKYNKLQRRAFQLMEGWDGRAS
mmetsp:Transcript_11594/g.37171  ORF Transcript_11594/g.37171 Transcript_11594/m.37171 type:complete len:301 (-) Transcript_11594:105-1007(-)